MALYFSIKLVLGIVFSLGAFITLLIAYLKSKG